MRTRSEAENCVEVNSTHVAAFGFGLRALSFGFGRTLG